VGCDLVDGTLVQEVHEPVAAAFALVRREAAADDEVDCAVDGATDRALAEPIAYVPSSKDPPLYSW
jgi:hypothetical protein